MASSVIKMGNWGRLSKTWKRSQTFMSAFKEFLFDLDIYAYTPSLISTQFSTWVSLVVSLTVLSLWIFAVGYTTYLWAVTPLSVSQGEVEHRLGTVIVDPTLIRAGKQDLALPIAGAMLMLGDGTSLTPFENPGKVRIEWEQATICNSDARQKYEDVIPSLPCTFRGEHDGLIRTNTTICPDMKTAQAVLNRKENTASNPCNTSEPNFRVPRIAGTFYLKEYSYLTATVYLNSTMLQQDPALEKNIFKGSVQLYMSYPYTGTTSLKEGKWPDGNRVLWSRRVNLLQNVNMKWEITLRVRQVEATSFWWGIPQLEKFALDFAVNDHEVSMATSGPSGGWVQVAKVYLKLDDRDMSVSMAPFSTMFSMFSDWGGFLSILVAVGVPALIYNHSIFRGTVRTLLARGDIVFNEALRKHRSDAIKTSFATGLQSVTSMQPPDIHAIMNSSLGEGGMTSAGIPKAGLPGAPGDAAAGAAAGASGRVWKQGSGSSWLGGAGANKVTPEPQGNQGAAAAAAAGEQQQAPAGANGHGISDTWLAQAVAGHGATGRTSHGGAAPDHLHPSPQQQALSQAGSRPPSAVPIPPMPNAAGAKLGLPAAAGSTDAAGAAGREGEGETLVQEMSMIGLGAEDSVRAPATVGEAGTQGLSSPRPLGESTEAGEPGGAHVARAHGSASTTGGGGPCSEEVGAPLTLPGGWSEQGAAGGASKAAFDLGHHGSGDHSKQAPSSGVAQPSPGLHGHAPASPPSSRLAPRPPKPPGTPPKGALAGLDGSSGKLQGSGILKDGGGSGHVVLKEGGGSGKGAHAGAAGADAHAAGTPRRGSVMFAPGTDPGDINSQASFTSGAQAAAATATASILVNYQQDIFDDSDEEEMDFDDVVRHCTSECHALFHLRQVVKLVQHERSFLTCGQETMTMRVEETEAKGARPPGAKPGPKRRARKGKDMEIGT